MNSLFSLKSKIGSLFFDKPWLIPLLASTIVAGLFYKEFGDNTSKELKNVTLIPVLISAREMPQGHILQTNDFSESKLPKPYLPLGCLFPSDASKSIGHHLIRPIAKGEIILWSAIDVGFSLNSPSRKIAKGYRALAISVDLETSVGNAIRPGDNIDMITSFAIPGETSPTTLTLLQNVAVLEVGTQTSEVMENTFTTVTLMVLPKEVGIILHAARNGKLMLALRHPEDSSVNQRLPLVGDAQILETALLNSLQEERNRFVEIIQGGKENFEPTLP